MRLANVIIRDEQKATERRRRDEARAIERQRLLDELRDLHEPGEPVEKLPGT